jgi:hypothetical protein
MKSIGVGISIPKSVICEPRTTLVCEFAAKLCKELHNVGPLPLGTIYEGGRENLFTLWTALKDRIKELELNHDD